jgi:hypothetical protein
MHNMLHIDIATSRVTRNCFVFKYFRTSGLFSNFCITVFNNSLFLSYLRSGIIFFEEP